MRKIPFLLFVLFCLISTPIFAFAEDNSQVSEASIAQETAQEAKSITAIEIKGNKAISTNTIVSKMKTRIGSPYQENIINDDLKRLYLLNFFSDIKINYEDYKGGVKVIVTVVERPIIDKITFSGIGRITMKDEKLKAQLKSREGQYLDYPNLDQDVRILKKMYEKIGFSEAKVEYKIETDSQTNKVKINFNVIEGGKIRIKNILIE